MTYLPTPREGPSPFLEGTCIQYAFDSTCLGSLKRCARKYQLEIIEGWRSKADNVHLTFGLHYTEALEFYDLLRADPMFEDRGHERWVEMVVHSVLVNTWVKGESGSGSDVPTDLFIPPTEGHRWEHGLHDTKVGNKNFVNLLRSIIWYLDEFRQDPAQTVIAEDGTPLVERSFRMELDWGPQATEKYDQEYAGSPKVPLGFSQPYLLCGHLDRVVNFLGATYVMDHKTTKTTVSDYYFDQYEPNNQMTLYTIAARVIFSSPIRGVIIDAAQVAVGFSRFARGFTYRTPAQLDEWMKDLRYWLGQAEQYATDGYWPMNDQNCFGCPFNQHDAKICAKDPSVRETFLKAKFTKSSPWNPLKVRN